MENEAYPPRSDRLPASMLAAVLIGVVSTLVPPFGKGGPGGIFPTGPATAAPASAPPPIVLVSIDTLRSDRLPVYGYRGVATPALDALRRDGVLFERVYAPAPLTLPSHASIFTGLAPPEHGVRDNIGFRLDAERFATLPRLLRAAGYATGAAVSAYVLRGDLGFGDGFDFYDDRIPRRARAGVGGLQRPGGETLRRVLPWLEKRGAGPFFLFFHLFEPHTPYAPPEPFASRYPSPYDGEIAAADAVVGELVTALRRLGVYDRAAIVVLSDHGEGLGDHGEDEHGVLLYRESLQVPLIVKLPEGDAAGGAVATPVALEDVFATLLELAGVEPPAGRGRSFLGLLDRAGKTAAARPIYSETFFPRLHFGWSELRSMIDGRWHFIDGPDPELYDLETDPGETRNLVREERATARRLRVLVRERDATLAAPAPVTDEERRRLAALGYVGTGGDADDGALPDPKTRLATVADLKACLRHYAAGELAAAAAACRRAVAEHPRSLDAWEHLGRAENELGRRDEALAAFERALALAAGRANHLAVAAALILLEKERPDAALALLARERRLAPDELALLLLEGRAQVVAGRLDDALRSAEEAVRRAPENADAVYLRGAVQIGRKALDAAERDLRRALALAPDHAAAQSDLRVLLEHRDATVEKTADAAGAPRAIRFRRVDDAWGIDFRHHDGASGRYYMVETNGGGVAIFDADGDGDEDLFLVDGGVLPGYRGERPRSRLYRNRGDGRFDAVLGPEVAGYGSGAAAGDVDGDGDLDLYVTAFGPNRLFRNDGVAAGGIRFTEIGAAAGVDDPLWSASAAFADPDRDGDLDLYVTNYVDFTVENNKPCGDRRRGLRGYCGPDAYDPLPDRFYRNRGDGTFEDATAEVGLDGARGAGLAVAWTDLDGDGWLDLYVANDLTPNFLFRNLGGDGRGLRFEDRSLLSGTAYGPRGLPEAGMGIAAADLDGDLLLDLAVTNYEGETNAFYRNRERLVFDDRRFAAGLAEPSLRKLAFGIAAADFDHDGDLDLAIANGHVRENAALFNPASVYRQPNQVFENLGEGRFQEVTDAGLDGIGASRGLATGDLDGDGDLDLVVTNVDDRVEVYENLLPAGAGSWLQIDLRRETGNRFGVGARIEVEADGRRQVREVAAGSSYLSQHALTAHFGLGAARSARVVVRWPEGTVQTLEAVAANQRIVIRPPPPVARSGIGSGDDQKRVDDARDDAEDGQQDVDHELFADAALQQDGERRQ